MSEQTQTLNDPRVHDRLSVLNPDQVQPGPPHPEGGEGEGRPLQEEDAVAA